MRRRTKLLETALALLHPRGFDGIEDLQDLSLQPQQLGAGLAKLPVVVGEFPHGGKLLRRRGDISRPARPAIAQHSAGVEFALGTVAGGFSAAAAEGIEGAGQQGIPCKKGLQEGRELFLELAELPAERTEVVGHGVGLEAGRKRISVRYYIY
jgi:hypothetical protein